MYVNKLAIKTQSVTEVYPSLERIVVIQFSYAVAIKCLHLSSSNALFSNQTSEIRYPRQQRCVGGKNCQGCLCPCRGNSLTTVIVSRVSTRLD